MKTKILLGLVAILTVFGCKDSFDKFDGDPFDPPGPPVVAEFNASAFVEVMDAAGNPIEGATINLGTASVSTNEYGVVFLDDVEMGSITYLTVDRQGYFHGSRRFYPEEGKTSYLRVMLLEEVVLHEFQSDQGGMVQFAGVHLVFPENAISDASGNPYSGAVTVSAAALAADDEHISEKMPGDLVGRTLTGDYQALASFGMAAVELRTPAGEALQVLEGSTVEMTVEIPVEMMGIAPAVIPTWSFDETKGIWVEEGIATLEGGSYLAQIPHFTWWNIDAPYPLTKLGLTFVFDNGAPATQTKVGLYADGLGVGYSTWTGNSGSLCGLVPKDEVLLLEVYDPCNELILSQEIGPFSDTTFLPTITLSGGTVFTTQISGIAVNCDGNPVTEGFVRVGSINRQYWFTTNGDGEFGGSIINCEESSLVVSVIDEEALKQSLTLTFPYNEIIDAGTISVCDELQEIVTLDLPEYDTTYTWLYASGFGDADYTTISVQDSSFGGSYFYLRVEGVGVGTFTGSGEIVVVAEDNTGTLVTLVAEEVNVTFTYYGESGDLIQGTFEGVMMDPSGALDADFSGTFSAVRY